jgi:hypothetical protein
VFLYLRDNRVQSAAPAPTPAVVSDQTPVDIDDDLDVLVSGNDEGETDVSVLPEDLAFELPTNGALTAFDSIGNIVELGEPIEVPQDYLTVVFGVSSERALGGRVRPGDTVAVIVSFADDVISDELDTAGTAEEKSGRTTDVLLHKALVTDVQVEDIIGAVRTTDGLTVGVAEGSVSGTNSQVYYVTLALPSTQIERLIYALEYGQIWLANQPSTAGDATNGIVTQDNIHEEVSIFIDRDDLLVGGPEEPAEVDGDAPADSSTDAEVS